MKLNRTKVFLYVALLLVFLMGRFVLYSRSERFVLDHSDHFILYSLLPNKTWDDARLKGKFYKNGILGQTEITDPAIKAKLVSALYGDSFFPSFFGGAEDNACFNPRHGIRATGRGRTVEAEICFECGAVWFYENGQSRKQSVSWEPQKVFDQTLIDAHLPRDEK